MNASVLIGKVIGKLITDNTWQNIPTAYAIAGHTYIKEVRYKCLRELRRESSS